MAFHPHTDIGKLKNSPNKSIVFIQEGIEVQHISSTINEIVEHDEVHIHPKFIQFKEASEGITCQQSITIKNTGKKSAFVRIYQTKSISFQIESLNKGIILNPGFSIRTIVTYSFKRPSLLHVVIPIEINGEILDYRVICKLLVEGISIEPKSIDFGIVDIGHSSGIKIITLKNEGGKSTRFSIDLGINELEITVKPMRGIVRPNKPIQLTVEISGINEGTFVSEFWIKSVPNIRIPFNIKIIIPRLVIYHPNTTGDFTLIDFAKTVANTRKYDSFVVRNISSQVASYVVLGEIDNEFVCVRNIDRKKYPVYSVFEIRPTQGRIGPFEGIIFEVGFTPIDSLIEWRKTAEKSSKQEKDFMAFLRIVRVHVTETKHILKDVESVREELNEDLQTTNNHKQYVPIMHDNSSSSSLEPSIDSDLNDIVRLCLHGETEVARLFFQPDILYFGELYVGENSQRVVRISNPLKFAPLFCRYVRNASAHCYPETILLKPEGSIEVLLKVRGKENISSSFKIYFDIAADSCESMKTRRQTKIKVGRYSIQCRVNVKLLVTTKQSCMTRAISSFEEYYKDIRKLPKDTRKMPLSHFFTIESKLKKDIIEKKHDDNEEIMGKVIHIPKWKHKKISETVKCYTSVKKLSTSTEVLIPLTPLQIYNVRMYPTLFAFGMVVPKTRNYKQLIVENLNDFSIMIRFTSLSKFINFPEGNLIILSPGLIATRLVEFRAYRIGKFNGYIDYLINDNHSFELSVTANIVEKQLSLDTREITLGQDWLKEEIYRPMDCAIQIRNKLDAKTKFQWEIPSTSCFFVEPISGVVRGNASLLIYIYYKPDFSKSTSAELIMKCENSSYNTIRISIPGSIPKVSFIKDIINIGEIPLNLPTKTIAFLRNFEYVEIEFEIDSSSLVHGCIVRPLHGIMSPRAVATLEIYLTFSLCFHFTMVIRVTIQKHLNLQLKVIGNVSYPQLKLNPQFLHLRRISASAYQHYLINATNVGTTMLKLKFLLEEYPEFRICLSSQRHDPGIGNKDIFIAPNTSQEFHLHFDPIDLASYAFYLPIVINGIIGPVSITHPKSLKPSEHLKQFKGYYINVPNFILEKLPPTIVTMSIDCTVAGHLIFFNKLEFHFNILSNIISDEFYIKNYDSLEEKIIQIDISNFSIASCPFSIHWSNGEKPIITSDYIQCTLEQGKECSFELTFQPKSRGNFNIEAPIFIHDELNGGMFNKLCLIGEYPACTIQSEFSDIFFTPVPLNTSIEKKFHLIIKYFEKDTVILAKKLSPEYSIGEYMDNILLIHFVDTNVVYASEFSELEVRIIFKSKAPVSFRTTIEFFDGDRIAICPVTIYATSDNCLLTTYMYLRNSIIDFEKIQSSNFDKRTCVSDSYISNFTDEENEICNQNQKNKKSDLKIGILTYFTRKNRISFEKLTENKYKLAIYKSDISYEKNNHNIEEDTKKFVSEKPFSEAKIPNFVTDITTKEIIQESMQYPFFPFDNKNNEYEIYMIQTLQTAEEWLYNGPFKFNFYFDILNIPMVLSKFYSKKPGQFRTTIRKGPELGLVGVLESLLGPVIYDYIGKFKEPPEKNDIERANYIFNFYDTILTFLTKYGAYLCHVLPQFLLNYDDYVILMENTRSKAYTRKSSSIESIREILSQKKFECRSKQCWLDIILQMYKCFVLRSEFENKNRMDSPSFIPSLSSRRSTRDSQQSGPLSFSNFHKESENIIIDNIHSKIIDKSSDIINYYSLEERLLLGWLSYHYEEGRKQEWMTDFRVVLNPYESKDIAEARNIKNFDKDLSDSLVLITVTAAYCPFLIEESLNNIYIQPRNYEEVLHNAICVVNAWRKIRLGFIISPLDIIYPNCVKMLMLVAYLYNILPTYIPKATIKFSCPLSETVTRQINFTNPTSNNVGFLIQFFGNKHGFFTTMLPQSVIHLTSHGSTIIKIQFYARKIKKTKAYLLLCGSTIGPHFGRNQTFILEGQVDCLGIANEYTIYSKLYQAVDKILTINVPYKNSIEYEIWASEERPTKPNTLKQTRWTELCLRKIPRRLFINQNSIIVKENMKKAFLSVTVACLSPCHRSFWIIFQSKIGDFIIQINSHWQSSLTDNIIIKWNEQIEKCICTEQNYNEMCPLNLIVPIPSRNKQLWSCVAHMFQKTLNPKERLFWTRYLDTHIGLRLIRWLMGDNTDSAAMEFNHIFDKKVTYNVTISDTSHILRYPKTFIINDIRPRAENTPINIHISPFIDRLCEIILTLVSINGNERRMYVIDFLHM